jgi:enoyl-CoA hydratase/carnithine racemase
MVSSLESAVDRLADDPQVRVVVLRGRGTSFCAGADLTELSVCSPAEATSAALGCAAVMDRLARLPVPLVAAMHGNAVGGGFLISLYCDWRIARADTQLGLPAASRQWLPPWAMSRLAAWVGLAKAQQILLCGGMFTADEAQRRGLLDQVVDGADEQGWESEIRRTTQRLGQVRRDVVGEIRSFFASLGRGSHQQWDQLSSEAFGRCFDHPEARAAIRAFLSRRESRE